METDRDEAFSSMMVAMLKIWCETMIDILVDEPHDGGVRERLLLESMQKVRGIFEEGML